MGIYNKVKTINYIQDTYRVFADTSLNIVEQTKLIFICLVYKRISDTSVLEVPPACSWEDVSSFNLFHNVLDNLRKILGNYTDLYEALNSLDVYSLYDKSYKHQGAIQEHIHSILNKLDFTLEAVDYFEFDSIITSVFEDASRGGRGNILQHEIIPFSDNWVEKLMANMLAPKTTEALYFPYCGTGSIISTYANYIQESIDSKDSTRSPFLSLDIQGTEQSSVLWGVAKLRLAVMGGMNVSILNTNSADFGKVFDVIAFIPPFGNTHDDLPTVCSIAGVRHIIPRKRKEVECLFRCFEGLTPKGRLGIVVPAGFVLDESFRKIRQALVESNYVETVILLPERTFFQSAIKTVLLILNKNKNKESKHVVAMGVFPTTTYPLSRNADVEAFVTSHRTNESSENWFFARMEDIQRQDYNLSPARYVGTINDEIEALIQSSNGRRLDEICTIVRGRGRRAFESEEGIPFISAKDLSGKVTDPYLNLEDVTLSSYERDIEVVNYKCILISRLGRLPKPTTYIPERVLKNSEETEAYPGIIPSSNVFCLIPNEDIVDFEYFYYQLTTSIFLKQYDRFSKQVGIPSISVSDLKKVIIPVLPSIEQQREVTRQLKEAYFKEANAKVEAMRAILNLDAEKQDAEFKIVGHLTHNLRHKITDIQSTLSQLNAYLDHKGLLQDSLQEKLSAEDRVEVVGEVIEKSLVELQQMHNLLEKTRELIVEEIKPESFKPVHLEHLLRQRILPMAVGKNYGIKISGKLNSAVVIEETYFVEMFINLIRNAEVHGFTDPNEKYEVMIQLSENPQSIIIDYTNNGNSLPPEFTEDTLFGYGVKRSDSPGEGLGGSFIGKVIRAHKGELEIISKNPVHFRIELSKEER